MNHKEKNKTLIDSTGYTLIELMVAMALLLSVALPAGMFLGYMAHYPKNKEKILALGEAQTALEQMIQSKKITEEKDIETLRRGWALERQQVIHDSSWVSLRVTVYRRDKSLVSLETVRIMDKREDDEKK